MIPVPIDSDTLRQIRNLIPDTDAVFDGDFLFTDEQITDFYTMGYANIFWATGIAQQAVGNSELLIQKVITNYETKTDGATAQKQWLASAKANMDLGREQLANPYGDGALDYIDVVQGKEDQWNGTYVELVGRVPWWIGD